jgi:hypothetical protein
MAHNWKDRPLRHGGVDHVDRAAVIRVVGKRNLKRRPPRERYARYRDGMTVAEYIAAVRNLGQSEQKALDDLSWDQNQRFIRLEPPPSMSAWSVAEAKAKLSEILSLARAGEPQTIGFGDPCVVVSAQQFERYFHSEHLGRFLIESAPRGYELDLPSRAGDRGNPFAFDDNDHPA